MSISSHKNDDSIAEQERRYLRGISSRADITRKFCERGSNFTGISSAGKAQKGVVVEQVLKLFGYREKTANAVETIQYACLLNAEASERLEKVKATLNGEYDWFKGEGMDELTSE